MNETFNTGQDVLYSDNSHIFGMPIRVVEGIDAFMLISREDAREWIERVAPFGIEFHFDYIQG